MYLLQQWIALDDFSEGQSDLLDRRTIELSDYWAFGLLDFWTIGLLGIGTIGTSDYWTFGLLGLRTIGPTPVDLGFEPRSGQTKDYEISICCFSAKHAALRRKSKDWLARNQTYVSLWSDMSIRGLLFQWASTIKIQLSVLVWYKADLISLKIILFLPWYSWVGIKQQSLNAMKQ